jgi:hypothetical protein
MSEVVGTRLISLLKHRPNANTNSKAG